MGKNKSETGVCGEDGCGKDIVKEDDGWKHKEPDPERDPLLVLPPNPLLGH